MSLNCCVLVLLSLDEPVEETAEESSHVLISSPGEDGLEVRKGDSASCRTLQVLVLVRSRCRYDLQLFLTTTYKQISNHLILCVILLDRLLSLADELLPQACHNIIIDIIILYYTCILAEVLDLCSTPFLS